MKYIFLLIISISLITTSFIIKNNDKKAEEKEKELITITGSVNKITHDGSTTRYYVDFIYNGQFYTEKTVHYSSVNGKYNKGDTIRIKYDPTGEKKLLIVDDHELVSVSDSTKNLPKAVGIVGFILLVLSLIMIIKSCI